MKEVNEALADQYKADLQDLDLILKRWADSKMHLSTEMKLRMIASVSCALRAAVTDVSFRQAAEQTIQLLRHLSNESVAQNSGI